MQPPRARAAFLLLYGALLAWQIDRWCFTPHGLASTWTVRARAVTVSAGSPAGVSQTFTMGADGLDGIWLRPVVASGSLRGELIVDLSAIHDDVPIRIERVVTPAVDAVRTGRLHVPFRMVRASRGSVYQVDVRHVRAGDGPAIELRATRDNALTTGRLFVDGREQWGDLVFATSSRRATLPYWIHEVLRPWPAWVSSWPSVVMALVVFNIVLAWACARAVGLGATGDESGSSRIGTGGLAVTPTAVAAVAVIAVIGTAVAGRPTSRYRSLDLISALPDARIETTWPALHDGVSTASVLFAGRIHRAIVAMPTSSISWTIDVPRDAVLRLGAAMRADMWEEQSDGIQMIVAVDDAGSRTVAADLTLFPMGVLAHRALMPVEVPLHRWAGQRVTIVLRSTPERWGNAVNDVPVWTEPRIEWPRNPVAGNATIVPR